MKIKPHDKFSDQLGLLEVLMLNKRWAMIQRPACLPQVMTVKHLTSLKKVA